MRNEERSRDAVFLNGRQEWCCCCMFLLLLRAQDCSLRSSGEFSSTVVSIWPIARPCCGYIPGVSCVGVLRASIENEHREKSLPTGSHHLSLSVVRMAGAVKCSVLYIVHVQTRRE